jgi:hypothetical protein
MVNAVKGACDAPDEPNPNSMREMRPSKDRVGSCRQPPPSVFSMAGEVAIGPSEVSWS